MLFSAVFELATLTSMAGAIDNGVARTPPMGWSTWNKLRCNFNDDVLLGVAAAMKTSGLVEAGYSTLNIDDCWPLRQRAEDGHLPEDPAKFPTGMRNFSSELGKRGLGLGIYTSHGNLTCQKFPGSYGYEEIDAKMYADWDVKFVKNDWCSHRSGYPTVPDLDAFEAMRDALNRTGKPMVYSVHWNYWNTKGPTCDFKVSCPLPDVANMWRIGGDIKARWSSVLQLIDLDAPLAGNAGPGRWNDADMMEVGNGMSEDQDRAHFSMWCMLASPLVAGNDVRTMSETTRQILTNKHAIAVNQDPLGKQATVVADDTSAQTQVWAKKLATPAGSWAVALLNRGTVSQNITANFDAFEALEPSSFEVLDLWADATSLGVHTDFITASVPATAAAMYKLVPKSVSTVLV